jgi:hypothetical protein
MVDFWIRVLILFCVEKIMDGSGSNNLIEVIMVALLKGGGLTKEDVAKKLCFGVDVASIIQGGKTRVIKQIIETWVPLSMGVHCVAHRTKLVVQYLSNLTFIACIEAFMVNMCNYFNHSPKQHLEFQKFVTTMETKVNKIIKNVKTHWMSMLEPLKQIMTKYRPLFGIM